MNSGQAIRVASITRPKPVVVDLFAGCGGLSLGLELAGFRPVLVCELNKDALATYVKNRPAEIEQVRDIHALDTERLRALKAAWASRGITDIDLVAGGPPCQGYSGIGHRRSYAVDKKEVPSNYLYREMARVIESLTPRLFLFENVRGLLHAKWTAGGEKGEIWKDVLRTFCNITGYQVRWKVVQAKHYGVPQNRPRILLVGVRDDQGWKPNYMLPAEGLLPVPVGDEPPGIKELLSDLVDKNYRVNGATTRYRCEPKTEVQRSLRRKPDGELMDEGHPLTEQEYSSHSERVRTKFKYMLKNGGRIPEKMRTKKFAQRVLPAKWSKQRGPTITATSLPDDYIHYSLPRILTVREWARLQLFPDWYSFEGKRTTGGLRRAGNPRDGVWDRELPKYTQIGNAVPVRLAQRVGEHLLAILEARSLPEHRDAVSLRRLGSQECRQARQAGG